MSSFEEYLAIKEFINLCEVMKPDVKAAPLSKHVARRFPMRSAPIPNIQPKDAKAELKKVMGPDKTKHSLRVGQTLEDIGIPLDAVHAAFFHDYAERGGNLHDIVDRLGLTPTTVQLIHLLTDEKNGNVVKHVMSIFSSVDEDIRNLAILVKISDRLDNLTKRLKGGDLTAKYLSKSRALLKWLFQNYTGIRYYIEPLQQQLFELGVNLGKLKLKGV